MVKAMLIGQSAVSSQQPAVSGQRSAVSGQQSAVSAAAGCNHPRPRLAVLTPLAILTTTHFPAPP
jgi:hypothetical protein